MRRNPTQRFRPMLNAAAKNVARGMGASVMHRPACTACPLERALRECALAHRLRARDGRERLIDVHHPRADAFGELREHLHEARHRLVAPVDELPPDGPRRRGAPADPLRRRGGASCARRGSPVRRLGDRAGRHAEQRPGHLVVALAASCRLPRGQPAQLRLVVRPRRARRLAGLPVARALERSVPVGVARPVPRHDEVLVP